MRSAMLQINLSLIWTLPKLDLSMLNMASEAVNAVFELSKASYVNEYCAHPDVPVTDWKTRFYASELLSLQSSSVQWLLGL
jgi:hypothetical protein